MPKLALRLIKFNPKNPRKIDSERYNLLLKSLRDFPEMLELRPLVIDNNNMVIGGNMRLKALKELGIKDVHVIRADKLTEEQKQEFIIKDNLPFGEWDFDMLINDWDNDKLNEWGLEMPVWEEPEQIEPSGYDSQQNWFLNIRFVSENECQQWYERLLKEGLDIKIVS